MQDLQSLIQQKIGQREQEVGLQEQQLNALQGQPKKIDLTPLMMAADMFADKGSPSLSGMYSKLRPEDNTMKIQALRQQLMQQKQGLTGDQIDLLKTINSGKESQDKDLSANMVKTLNEGNAIPGMLSNVSGLIEANKDDFGPIEGRARLANPYDTDAQSLDAEMRAKSQMFGRFMEGGVLRKEDEEKYKKMFPSMKDTPEVAQNKLLVVEDLLRKKQESDLKAFKSQGFDITGLELPQSGKKQEASSLQVGSIEDGYEFLGGDPQDEKSWRKK